MKEENIEVVRGSGNVFRDLGYVNPDLEQLRATLAARIIKLLDQERLTVRAAQGRTGIAAADFSRIRNADLSRFTIDRLIRILNRLGARVDATVTVRPASSATRKRKAVACSLTRSPRGPATALVREHIPSALRDRPR